jgi:hypothetical protein
MSTIKEPPANLIFIFESKMGTQMMSGSLNEFNAEIMCKIVDMLNVYVEKAKHNEKLKFSYKIHPLKTDTNNDGVIIMVRCYCPKMYQPVVGIHNKDGLEVLNIMLRAIDFILEAPE